MVFRKNLTQGIRSGTGMVSNYDRHGNVSSVNQFYYVQVFIRQFSEHVIERILRESKWQGIQDWLSPITDAFLLQQRGRQLRNHGQ